MRLGMNIEALRDLRESLRLIAAAAETLSGLPGDGRPSIMINMQPGEHVSISAVWLSAGGADCDDTDDPILFEIEDEIEDAPDMDPAKGMVGGSGDLQRHSHAESPPAEPAASEPEASESPVAAAEAPPEPPVPAPGRASAAAHFPFGRAWSADEDRRMLDMRAEGHSWADISEALGRTQRSCNQRMTRLNRKAGTVRAPKIALAPAAAPVAAAPGLTGAQRDIMRHLDSLDDNFAPEDDLAIIEGLGKGVSVKALAADMDCSVDLVTDRWRAMMAPDITDRHGRITIDGRRDLLAAAKARVAT